MASGQIIWQPTFRQSTAIYNRVLFQRLRSSAVPKSPPPRKAPSSERRSREFLYLPEVDALLAATQKTRSPIRNQGLVMLLFCQALQPTEICWLRWCDLNKAANTLLVARNRSLSTRIQPQVVVNLQPLCKAEADQLQHLEQLRVTDWIFASEGRQRLTARSLHHIIQQAGEVAGLPISLHPYMLRRSGLYYRAALLLQTAQLSLRECCLLWNRYIHFLVCFYPARVLRYRTQTGRGFFTRPRTAQSIYRHNCTGKCDRLSAWGLLAVSSPDGYSPQLLASSLQLESLNFAENI